MKVLHADWPAKAHVHALTTLRYPGVSLPPYEENNLALHVGDVPAHVEANRQALYQTLGLPSLPHWLEQTHSTQCIVLEETTERDADAVITRKANEVLAIMTADCLPIVFCNQTGTEIAAIHAGRMGLAGGILENTLRQLHSLPQDLLAWIGPGICQACYEVDAAVTHPLLQAYPFAKDFLHSKLHKWQLDLPGFAAKILQEFGLKNIFLSNLCTFEQKNSFFSYRRTQQTGRMVTLLWFTPTKGK